MLGNEPWAVEARETLYARFAADETAAQGLLDFVTAMSDILEHALRPPPPRSQASACASAVAPVTGAAPATQPTTAEHGTEPRNTSLGRIIAEQAQPRSPSPRAPVPKHASAKKLGAATPAACNPHRGGRC